MTRSSASRANEGISARKRMLSTALLALAATGFSACSRARHEAPRPPAPSAAPGPLARTSASVAPQTGGTLGSLRELTWRYDTTPFGPSEVVIAIPGDAPKDERWPVLVAFHGRGESLRGPKLGARGWLYDYDLRRAVRRLKSPPLSSEDLLGFVTDAHLAEL